MHVIHKLGLVLASIALLFLSACNSNSSQDYSAQIAQNARSLAPIAPNSANLPYDLYAKMVVQSISLDSNYNYNNLHRISSLPIFPQGYNKKKNLVDKVVVDKHKYQMVLLKNGQIVRKYWIALSDRPQGHKERQGDRRTPEGTYTLDYVKENSYYYRAFHISYPNEEDKRQARLRGVNPGGMILVHGQPPSNSSYHDSVQRSDWTNGCIAILNHEMDEFISLVDPGTPIQINP